MRVIPVENKKNQTLLMNKPISTNLSSPIFHQQQTALANIYYMPQFQPSFQGYTFEKTIVKTVKREFMGLGIFKNPVGFTRDFSKIGKEHLAKEKLDITKASKNEIYAYWDALACQEAYPEGGGTTWVRRYNKTNVPKPNAVFNTLNNPDIAHEKFGEYLEILQNPYKNKSLDAPPPGSNIEPRLSVLTDEKGRLQLDFICFDTETTGKETDAKIVQLASVQVKNGRTSKEGTYNQLINPEMPIPEEAIAVHGITDDMVENAPTILNILKDFLANHMKKSNGIISAYNAKFDINLLNNAIREHNISNLAASEQERKIMAEKQPFKVLDPFILVQKIHPYVGAVKRLSNQYQWLFCKEMDDAHDALADVKGAIDVLKYCLYYLSEHRKDKTVPLTLREVLIFQNGGRVENIDIPLDVEDCNDLVNFDKSYLIKPMSVVNYFKSYKLTSPILKELTPEIGEKNVQKLINERIVNKEIGKDSAAFPIEPAETEKIPGTNKFQSLEYKLKSNFRKVLGFANLEPYNGKTKEEIEDLIIEKSKYYFNGLIEDMHIKNVNPKDIPDGNDLPDIDIAIRVMQEAQEAA